MGIRRIFTQDTCLLEYSPVGSAGYYGVAIQIEDFQSHLATMPLSSVSLQFLFLVNESHDSTVCEKSLKFTSGTIEDGTVILLKPGSMFHTMIVAESSAAS